MGELWRGAAVLVAILAAVYVLGHWIFVPEVAPVSAIHGTRVHPEPTGYTPGLEDVVARSVRIPMNRGRADLAEYIVRDVQVMTGCRVLYLDDHKPKREFTFVGNAGRWWIGMECL